MVNGSYVDGSNEKDPFYVTILKVSIGLLVLCDNMMMMVSVVNSVFNRVKKISHLIGNIILVD